MNRHPRNSHQLRPCEPFDKYKLYQDSVQASEVDAQFLFGLYKRLRQRNPLILREDFCGTFSNLCAWVRINSETQGLGLDLDQEPVLYGERYNRSCLTRDQAKRISIKIADVLKVRTFPVDLITAFNFSYFIFKERDILRKYFRRSWLGLKTQGLLVVDAFGGGACQEPNEDRTRKRGYWYFWEQGSFDPVTGRAQFYIHFKRDGEKKRKRVFRYDWRMWTLPEIQEIMLEAGFSQVKVYWQGDDEIFRPVKKGSPDAAWIAYVVGLK